MDDAEDWSIDLGARTATHQPTGLGFRFHDDPSRPVVSVTLLGDPPPGLSPLDVVELGRAAEAALVRALAARH